MDFSSYNFTHIGLTILFCILINLPFGYWRKSVRKFSFLWFVFVHAPVPLVIVLRLGLHLPSLLIPVFILASVVGQYCGGKLKREKSPEVTNGN